MHLHRLVRPAPLVFVLAACPPGPQATSESESETSITSATVATTDTATSQGSSSLGTSASTDDPTLSSSCDFGDQRCNGSKHQICIAGSWADDPCPEGTACKGGDGTCQACSCTDPPHCLDANTIETCTCFDAMQTTCPAGQVCDDEAGECRDELCKPGETLCSGANAYKVCNEYGTGFDAPIACSTVELCDDAETHLCGPACEVIAKRESSLGCEFWGVDMSNAPPRDKWIYAIALSNPSLTETVTVELFDGNNNSEQKLLGGVIAPRQVKVFLLSGALENVGVGYYPGDAGFNGSGIALGRAFRVASNLPIVATQFNPLGGAAAYTTDASLLLPTHALGDEYFHLAWDQGGGSGSSLVVVATEEQTTVTIRPTVNLPAGQNGMPPLTKGVATQIVLGRYDYLQLETTTGDLTGSHIKANKPVALFGGHACGLVPTKDVGSCDHLEEQIFPVDTWGKEYVALRAPKRGNEDMHWRVLAGESGATVAFTPKPEGLAQAINTIPAGGFLQFNASGDFRVSSDKPILLGGYMYGSSATGDPEGPGDPSMVLMVPTEQWLSDYVFLVDSSYTNDNVRLVRHADNRNLEIGCLGPVPDDHWQSLPGTNFLTATVNINPGEGNCKPGTNTATSPEGGFFGIIVIGEAKGASYAYPGGMKLKPIKPG